MAAQRIAEGEVLVRLNDRGLPGDLKASEAKVQASMNRIGRMEAEPRVGINDSEFNREEAALRARLDALEKRKVDVSVGLDTEDLVRQERNLKKRLDTLEKQKRTVTIEASVDAGHIDRSVADAVDKTNRRGHKIKVETEVDSDAARRSFGGLIGLLQRTVRPVTDFVTDGFGQLGSKIGSVGTRIGPFTTSLKGAALAMLALSPVITGLLGGFGALIGTIGAGLVGALALGNAALVSFAVGAAGVGAVLVPLIGDLNKARAAQEAYEKAVLEHGRTSSQAAKKFAVLQHVFKGVGKENREAIANIGELGTRWRELTAAVRPDFFNTLGSGIRTLNQMMPTLAEGSKQAFRATADAVEDLFSRLRSEEAQGTLSKLFGVFSNAVGPITAGIGSLISTLANLAVAAGPVFQEIVTGFRDWADGLARATGDTNSMEAGIRGLVGHLRDFTDLLGSGAALAVEFFGAGAKDGQSMVRNLTDTINKTREWIDTAEGQKEVKEFFEDSVETVEDLAKALETVSGAFVEIADVAGDVEHVIGKALDFAGDLPIIRQLQTITSSFLDLVSGAKGFGEALLAPVRSFADVMLGAISTVLDAVSAASRSVPDPFDVIDTGAIEGAADKINEIRDNINGLGKKKVKIDIDLNKGQVETLGRALLDATKMKPIKFRVGEEGADGVKRKLDGIDAVKLRKKTQEVDEDGSNSVRSRLFQLSGFLMKKSTKNVDEQGSRGVLGMLGILRGFDLGTAIKRITESGGAHVSSVMAGIRSVTSLGTAVKNIVERVTRAGNAEGGHPHFGWHEEARAAGGASKTRGGVHARPTFLVGEENRPEVVIATNPSYRKKNVAHWMQAARMLGIPGFASGGITGADVGGRGLLEGPGVEDPKDRAGGFSIGLGAKPPGTPAKGGRGLLNTGGGRRQLVKLGSAWYGHWKTLGLGQKQIKSEIQLREARIPDDNYIKEVRDPQTGDVTGYEIDEGKKSAYSTALQDVVKWYEMLVNWEAAEVKRIQTIRDQILLRKSAGEREAQEFGDAIRSLKTQKRAAEKDKYKKGKKKGQVKDPRKIKQLERAIDQAEGKKDQGERVESQSGGWAREVGSRITDVGYDLRTSQDRKAGYDADLQAVDPDAARALSDARDSLPEPPAAATPADFAESELAQAFLTTDTADDITAVDKLIGARETELDAAIATGDPRKIKEAADALKSARDQKTSIQGAGGAAALSADQQALLAQAESLKAIVSRGNYVASSSAAVFAGAGDLGFGSMVGSARASAAATRALGGSQAASGGPSPASAGIASSSTAGGNTTIINTLHPGDPAVLQAIAKASNSGNNLLGGRTSPVEHLGA